MEKFLIKYILIIGLFFTINYQSIVYASFDDINGHWAEETIISFVEKEYITSVDSKFNPDSEIRKGEIATLINRYFDYGFIKNEEENLELTMQNGYLENSKTSEKITREEIAFLICKVLSLNPLDEKTSFMDDEMISKWAKGYVAALEKEKIMIGYLNQTYKPNKYITKAEFITVLNRCIGIGGADIEIVDTVNNNFEVGIFEFLSGEMKYKPIDNKLNLKIGDSILLAIKVPTGVEEEELKFDITIPNIIELDKNLLEITGIKNGNTEMKIEGNEYDFSFEIIVE